MKRHALLWFSLLFCGIAFKSYVNGAQCSQPSDCTATTYTTSTCTNNVCGCNAGTVAIRTGCGFKLATPTVNQEDGKTRDLIPGTNGTLTCSTVASSYAWFLDEAPQTATTKTITITKAGGYKCQAISADPALNSDKSDAITITLITASSQYTTAPTVTVSPTGSIFTGRNVTLTCSNAPMGFAGTISFLVDPLTTPVVQGTSFTAQLTMGTSYYGQRVSCRLSTFMTVSFIDSVKVDLPTEDTTIAVTSVAAIVKDASGDVLKATTTYYTGAVGPIITCQTTPAPESLNPANSLTYEFFTWGSSGRILVQSGDSKTYKVLTTVLNYSSYDCSAAGKSMSTTINIKVEANALTTAPALAKASANDLTIGSNLVLACGTTADATLNYTWLFNNTIIYGQADWKIQLNNFAESDIGVYKCRVSKYGTTSPDASFSATVKPTVTRVPSGTFYGQGGDYVLKCTTGSSVTNGWTYSWKKGNNDLNITTDSYSINNANATIHDSSYTCTSTYNGLSGTSDSLPVAVVDAGLRCTSAITCTGPRYKPDCPSATPQICTCASYFVARGEACELIKPTISRDVAGTVFYAGSTYVLTCKAASNDTTGWTFAWKKDDNSPTGSSSTYTITGANAATHNGSYTCTTTFSTVSSTSDALIVSVVVMKPTISTVPSGTIFAGGGDYALECNPDSRITSGWTYVWKKGDTDTGVTTKTYPITDAVSTTHDGSYTCTNTYNFASHESDSFTVAVEAPGKRCLSDSTCTGQGYTGQCLSGSPPVCTCDKNFVARGETCSLITPTISRVTAGDVYAEGGDYALKCNTDSNSNTGVTYVWSKDGTDTSVVSETYTITGATTAKDTGSYICTITYNGDSKPSLPFTLTVSAPGKRCTTNSDCTGAGYTGTCTTTLPKVCTCTPHYKLIGESCVFVKPIIIRITAGNIYGEGGDYVLKCDTGSSDNTGVTFVWNKGDNLTPTSETYTITGATTAKDAGSYTCTITYSGVSSISDALPITIDAPGKRCTLDSECTGSGYTGTCSSTSPKVCMCTSQYDLVGEACSMKKPTISRETTGTIYVEGGDYILKCNTANNAGLTYLWKKDGVNTSTTTETNRITGATAAANSGSYTCTITLSGDTSTSDAFAINVEAPGQRCTLDQDCTGPGYTGTCTTTLPKVCTCTPHYKQYGEACVYSGAEALISCVLMVIAASLGSMFF